MSPDFRHWLALACLLPALLSFAKGYDMPIFKNPERIEGLYIYQKGPDYERQVERFDQAVKEELTPRLKLEERGLCFLALAILALQLPKGWRPATISRRRLMAYGLGCLVALPVLTIDQSIRDLDRGLFPEGGASLVPYWFAAVLLDMALLLLLAPFLYRACRGLQGAGRGLKGAAGLFALSGLLLAIASLRHWEYVLLTCAGLLTLFFTWFLLGTQTRR